MRDLIVDAFLINNTNDTSNCQNPENLYRYEKVLQPGRMAEYARVGGDSKSLNGHIDFTTNISNGQIQLSATYNYATATLVPTPRNGGEQKYSISPPAGAPAPDILQGNFTITAL
ncbi:hypothetical protein PHO31112_03953 [Pandoraea horticolens]|uniref:Uncharacterized protein n=1 Tax=Pandoraea horticolens TaxID=2508298 RepID=A0A5E4XL64_9BURK|nr:hypothetical protein PHO31112_03953 [Pandoraea horticolens]